MTTENLMPRPNDGVNVHAREEILKAVEALLSRVEAGASARKVELEVWKHVLATGRVLLVYALSLVARQVSEEDLARRGLGWRDVHIRTDRDYWQTLNTTFGPICFLLYAYRDRTNGVAAVTRVPARDDARGSDAMTYIACDHWNVCDEAQVTITIAALGFAKFDVAGGVTCSNGGATTFAALGAGRAVHRAPAGASLGAQVVDSIAPGRDPQLGQTRGRRRLQSSGIGNRKVTVDPRLAMLSRRNVP